MATGPLLAYAFNKQGARGVSCGDAVGAACVRHLRTGRRRKSVLRWRMAWEDIDDPAERPKGVRTARAGVA